MERIRFDSITNITNTRFDSVPQRNQCLTIRSKFPYRKVDERLVIDTYMRTGSVRKAALEAGCAESSADKVLRRLKIIRHQKMPNRGRSISDFPTVDIPMLDKMICDTIRHSGVPARWAEDLKSEIWLKLLMRTWPVIRETKAFFTAAYKRTRIECRAVLRNARRGQGYGKHLWRERHLELDLK